MVKYKMTMTKYDNNNHDDDDDVRHMIGTPTVLFDYHADNRHRLSPCHELQQPHHHHHHHHIENSSWRIKCLLPFLVLMMMATMMAEASRRHWSSQSLMASANGHYSGEHSLRHHRGMCFH